MKSLIYSLIHHRKINFLIVRIILKNGYGKIILRISLTDLTFTWVNSYNRPSGIVILTKVYIWYQSYHFREIYFWIRFFCYFFRKNFQEISCLIVENVFLYFWFFLRKELDLFGQRWSGHFHPQKRILRFFPKKFLESKTF